jgi:benzoylformate decarboxylase
VSLGRDVILEYLRDVGVKYLFGVPGTNEVPLIDGTNVPGAEVAFVPCMHENIAMGAAMGYARASGQPGVVELHITPGAAHGIGNLFNAFKSHVPMVVLCAQQHTDLLVQEPVLASDLVQVARQYTKWSYEVRSAGELPLVMQRALKEALAPPHGPVFLSIPWQLLLQPVNDGPRQVTRVAGGFLGDLAAVSAAAARLAGAQHPIIVAGDGVGAAGAWESLQRLARLLGAPVYTEALSSYMNYPNHLAEWQGELPQMQAGMQRVFARHDVAFLCGFGAQAQVLVFDHARGPLIPASVAQVYLHNSEWEIAKNGYGEVAILGDIGATLPVLCEEVAAHPRPNAGAAQTRLEEFARLGSEREAELRTSVADRPADALPNGCDVAHALAALQPDLPAPLILVNEAVSDSIAFQTHVHFDDPLGYFFAQGGSLGYSMPASVGMKLAAGDSRTVVNVIGDGSALFYPGTWWTAQRFELPVLFVVLNNREYKTLLAGFELIKQTYHWTPAGEAWYLRLGDHEPVVSFVGIAETYGIKGQLVTEVGQLTAALKSGLAALAQGQPYLVEVLTDPGLPQNPPRLDALTASKESSDERERARFDHLGPV